MASFQIGVASPEHTPAGAIHRSLVLAIEVLLFGGLLLLVIQSPRWMVYDEVNTAPTVSAFHDYGMTSRYLSALTHGSGPLFGIVCGSLSSLFHDDVYRTRFLNYFLTCAAAGLLWWLLRRDRFPFAAPLAGAIIAVPTLWVCAGIALTEPVGIALLTAALIPLGNSVFEALDDPPWKRALRFLLAGVCIGFASLARQPFVLASLAVPAAALICRRHLASALLTPLASISILSPVLAVWHGLTPPLVGRHWGLSLEHGCISLAYGGLFTFLIAPGFLRFRPWQLWLALLSAVAINAPFRMVLVAPAESVAAKFIPHSDMAIYGFLCGTFLLALSIFYGITLLVRTTESRAEPWRLATHLGLILLLTWPTIMRLQYSSRYSLMALPFLMLAVKDHYRVNMFTAARTIAGGLLGAAILWTYYKS